MPYDPEDLGAQCYLCVLKEKRVGGPVPPEIHGGETVAVINDVPSQRDCDEQRPLTDGGGMEFTQTLVNIGQHRKKTAIFNAVCCRPPENDFDKLMLQWQRSNKKLVAKGEDALPSPIECCRPRLMKEVQGYNNFITLGKVAYKSLTESSSAILEIRGGPIEGRIDGDQFIFKPAPTGGVHAPGNWPVKLMPTIHPGMVTRVRKWTHAFRTDMARAFRFFKDQLNWVEPWMKFTPTPAELKAFIYSADQFAYDTETTVEDATVARLKCITISTGEGGVCVPFYSIETNRSVYKDSDLEEIKQILKAWFVDPRILKTGWNSGGFDVHIIENHLGVTPAPMLDGILLHRLVESELPHRLGYVGSVYTDVTAWKAAHTAKEARSDMELWTYGITDTIVTHRVIEVLAPIVQEKEQDHLVQKDHKIQELCAGMKHVGMWVDKDQRLKEAIRVQAEIIKYKQAAIRASGRPDLNLNSTYKLRDLLFGDWDLAPSEYTKSGDPSTGDDALRLIRTQNLSNTQVTTFIDALRMFRRASKEYGTYIARMIPYGQELKDVNLEWFDEDELGDDPEVARGLIMPDGRIHPNYLAHGTTSGRLSSSNPNSQNFPKHLRAMIKASPGHILVGADADQLELRIIASIAQIPIYLEAFAKGDDPHSHTAAMMFGEHFTKLEKKSTQWKNLRTLAKGIKYASFYGSGDETVHGIVTSGENEKGELLFPDLTLKQLRTIRRKWLGAIPQLPQWWDACLDYYRAYGYMKDPVWGRKRFFLNGEKFNEIVNFGPQCVPGWTRVLTSEGYLPIESLLGREVTAWTGKRWAKARVIPKGIKELYRIHTKRGMHFTCDDEHRGKFVGREGYEWRKFVGEARQNTRFALDLARPLEFGTPMADLDAYMAGYWIGDGHASREGHDGYAVGFTIASTKPNEMDPRAGDMMLTKVQTWAHARGLELKDKAGEGCFTPMIYRGATEWLKSIGADPAWKAHTKRVPNRIWTASLADRKDFIRGYLDSDGHMKKIGRVGIRSCQRDLLQDVMVLARTVGIESSISGPMAADKNGHEAFELHMSAAQTYDALGWGQGGKLRTSEVGETPYFEAKRVVDRLQPTCDSDKVIKSRIRYHEPAVSPYVLNRMGVDDIYDHDSFVSASTRRVCVPVYTLSVEDEDHQYVAEGVISKNSSGAHIIHEATFRILDAVPFFKWGKGTGLINQCHDALVFEVPYDHDKYEGDDQQFGWCKKGCNCTASVVANIIKSEMNVSVPGLPGVSFAAKPDIGMRWSEV